MSKTWAKRPSPAMIVALIALFAALGGSAYAAKKIGTKEIKANAITTGKIKKNAITTSKIKKEAVTGAKIKEASLGAVPNATNAVNATNATNATNAVNATNWSRYSVIGLTKVSLGQTVSLHSIGPFTIYGKCIDNGGGNTSAYTYVTTNQAKSSMASYEEAYYEADFEPGTEAQINYEPSGTGPETNMSYSYYGQFYLANADGSVRAFGNLFSGVHYFGASCAFWGDITNAS
jgi:hypothetical protein